MFHVFDRWGNPKPAPMTVLAARRTQNVDGTDNLDLLSDLDLEKGDRVAWRDHMGLWREWLVNSIDTSRSDRLPLSTAHCVDAIQELASTYIEDKRNRTATASACAKKALAGTRWILGTVHDGTKTTEADLAFYHTNALSAIQDICATFGLEAVTTYQPDATGTRIATRTLSLVSRRGAATPTKRFTYGKDLASIRRTIDATQVATRLYGWGKGVATTDDDGEETGGYSRKISFADINGGKAYVEDATALAIWGIPGPNGTRIHSEADAEFPDCEDPKQLLTLTKEALKTRSQPVVSYECDVTSLAAAGVNAEGTDIGDTVHIIDTSFPGQGIYVYDKPEDQNPTQCIHIGGGYWRIANSKKANGDWDFRALADGNGIYANAIYTGKLSDAAGHNQWNLDTGELTTRGMTATSITAEGTFTCGSKDWYGIELNSIGQLAGYRKGKKVGYIDYSGGMYEVSNPSKVYYGLQLQGGCLRISTPILSVAKTTDTHVTTTHAYNGKHHYISKITSSSDGTITWYQSTTEYINGFCIN